MARNILALNKSQWRVVSGQVQIKTNEEELHDHTSCLRPKTNIVLMF